MTDRRDSFRTLIFALGVLTPAYAAGQAYFVSDQPQGEIWRLQDVNGDGDALDVGEKTLWADGFASVVEMEFHNGDIFAIEEGMSDGSNQAIRLTDLNGDGDALDIGERSVWADGFDDPRGIAVDLTGTWFVTEVDDDLVWSLFDHNGDGDVLEEGERRVFADQINGATSVAVHSTGLLVTGTDEDQIFRLNDHNGDGDALDVGESMIITPTIDSPVGLLDDHQGGFFFSSFSNDAVYHAVDRNGDGDMLDVIETLSYADDVFGGLNGPWGMTAHDAGGTLLANFIDGEVLWVRDANGDGDALDQGDVRLFADGFVFPVDVVAAAVVECSPDADEDGDVDGLDLLILQRENPEKIPLWEANYGEQFPQAAAACRVPEPYGLTLAACLAGLGTLRRSAGISRGRDFLRAFP